VDEFDLHPVLTVPEGISAESPFPIRVRFPEGLPKVISEAADFCVWLLSLDGKLEFDDGASAFHILLQDGEASAMARMKEPADSATVRAVFFFGNRYSGNMPRFCVIIPCPGKRIPVGPTTTTNGSRTPTAP
jgi:hypothetical protein